MFVSLPVMPTRAADSAALNALHTAPKKVAVALWIAAGSLIAVPLHNGVVT